MTSFYPTNQNTLYLLHLFYSDNEIITVHGRPAICTLIGCFKSSRQYISLSVSMHLALDFLMKPTLILKFSVSQLRFQSGRDK